MKSVVNLRDLADLKTVCNLPVSEILVQCDDFSRFGGVDFSNLAETAAIIKSSGKRCTLSWDCLAKNSELNNQFLKLKPIIDTFHSIRFLDPGVGQLLQAKSPDMKLQLSLEHGSLNRIAIQQWVDTFLPQLEKVILSPQLPLKALSSIEIDPAVGKEILLFGPLEMFYSRRKLLENQNPSRDLLKKTMQIASDDRPTQKSCILQTSNGTIAFYDRQLNLFNTAEDIAKTGISEVRVEYVNKGQLKQIISFFQNDAQETPAAENASLHETRGFIQKNLTDRLFGALSNPYLKKESEFKVGTVLESVKHSYSVIRLQQEIELPSSLNFVTPEGKKVTKEFISLKDLKNNDYCGNVPKGVYLAAWTKFVVPGSMIILSSQLA